MLLRYGKQSLSQLSSNLGRAKSTVSNHASQLSKAGLIQITERKARGSIDAKVFELVPEIYNQVLGDKWPHHVQAKDDFLLQRESAKLELVKLLLDHAILLNSNIVEKRAKPAGKAGQQQGNFADFSLWTLSKREIAVFRKLYAEFLAQFSTFLRENRKAGPLEGKTHIIFHAIFPLLEMAGVDLEKKHFRGFQSALDG